MRIFSTIKLSIILPLLLSMSWHPAFAMDLTFDFADFQEEVFCIGGGKVSTNSGISDFSEADIKAMRGYVNGIMLADNTKSHGYNPAFDYGRINTICNQILDGIFNSKRNIFLTLPNLIREIKHRINMAYGFDLFLGRVDYNKGRDDRFVLPSCWITRPCQFEGDTHHQPFLDGAYTVKSEISCFQAIQTCKTSDLILDCSGAAMTYSYISLSDVVGATEFNQNFVHDTFYLSTFNTLLCGRSSDAPVANPFFELVTSEFHITDLSELIPGDIVYFQNYPDYSEKHKFGYCSGEYAVFVGNIGGKPHFRGHGIETASYDAFIKALKVAYGKTPTKGQLELWKEEAKDLIDSSFPGLCKTIYVINYFRLDGFKYDW